MALILSTHCWLVLLLLFMFELIVLTCSLVQVSDGIFEPVKILAFNDICGSLLVQYVVIDG